MQRLFANELEIDISPMTQPCPAELPLAKIGDDWNDETERRFRAEAEPLVSKVEANRKIIPYVSERANGDLISPQLNPKPVPLRIVRSA
jgi:hypothetical protein